MSKAILIFPAGMPRALSFLEQCLRDGSKVIGASSLAHDPSRPSYPEWQYLPYISDAGFDQALARAIQEQDIGSIYTANPVVWDHLQQHLGQIAPGVKLLNEAPANEELTRFRAAKKRAHELLGHRLPLQDAAAKPGLSIAQLTSLLLHTDAIPGMCDHQKVHALYEVARHSPSGDLVEIGSWWGKSAFVLLRLAQCFNIGHVLCVDPWSDEHLVQQDASAIVDKVSKQVSADEAFDVFLGNLLPYARADINYLRMPSTAGAIEYGTQKSVQTEAFGETRYQGQIALLHIDGNHSFDNASADILAWSKYVVSGGWIVIDDYTWPFGDGPRRAADAYLAHHHAEIDTAFFMGGALFIQKKVQHA
ncbi:hypothetical protein UNDKW_4067 [Undibacterium sp. KW1]|uniref:class I SAM-dependent methyltransferase n=1 Tax=Undibacterium sp. KW1 TaxID=2058624 RepID=UPI001331D44F|nr:class I SAM-dependent methyltransferase [Undibacterium sp. KW1]BBB62340.1 hypothetical protein UNDKW_4067 [Undibacterium sp. KW1]